MDKVDKQLEYLIRNYYRELVEKVIIEFINGIIYGID